MDKLLTVSFAYPWFALCLPLPWIVYYLLPPVRIPMQSLYAPSLFTLMKQYTEERKEAYVPKCSLNQVLFIALWCLLLISAAGPYYTKTVQPADGDRHHIMLALDISDSMSSKDVILSHGRSTSRLEAAKYFLKQLISHFPSDKIGLILFGTQPYLVTPLTHNHATLVNFLQYSKTGMAGGKTALGDTLSVSINSFPESDDKNSKIMVLLTDGTNTAGTLSPLVAATHAANHNIHVYTLGVGSRYAQNDSELDEAGLQKIAEISKANYFHMEQPDAVIQLKNEIKKQKKNKTALPDYTTEHSLLLWPLSLVLFISFPWVYQRLRRLK